MFKSVANLTRRGIFGLGLAAILSQAGYAAEDPKQFIQNLSKQVVDALARGAGQSERQALFRDLLNKAVDTELVGKAALGRYVHLATPEQMQQYNQLFKEFVALTYAKQLGNYAGQTMVVKDATPPSGPDQASTVSSEIEQKEGAPIKVDWRVKPEGDSLKIIDVKIEGVSMVLSQRDDFASVIQSGGGKFEALLTRLKEQDEKLRSGEGAAAGNAGQ